MINWYGSIKMFYDDKLWNKAQIWDAVSLEKITPEQYEEIVGESHPTERPVIE
jgi:uncharacterized XkdX family phage protein